MEETFSALDKSTRTIVSSMTRDIGAVTSQNKFQPLILLLFSMLSILAPTGFTLT